MGTIDTNTALKDTQDLISNGNLIIKLAVIH